MSDSAKGYCFVTAMANVPSWQPDAPPTKPCKLLHVIEKALALPEITAVVLTHLLIVMAPANVFPPTDPEIVPWSPFVKSASRAVHVPVTAESVCTSDIV